MFRTFYLQHSNMADFDRLLENIVTEGYQPVYVREFFRPRWNGYQWEAMVEVFVTARKVA